MRFVNANGCRIGKRRHGEETNRSTCRQIIELSVAGEHPFIPRLIFLDALQRAALALMNNKLKHSNPLSKLCLEVSVLTSRTSNLTLDPQALERVPDANTESVTRPQNRRTRSPTCTFCQYSRSAQVL